MNDATRRASRRSFRLLLLPWIVAATACAPPPSEEPSQEAESPPPEVVALTAPREIYARQLIFLLSDPDSSLIVPVSFQARVGGGLVNREIRAWLMRSGQWEPFFEESWFTQPQRSPWRIHPRGPLRILVGPDESLLRVVYEEGARRLELIPGEVLAEFSGPRGGTYRLQNGDLLLADRRISGLMADVSQGWRPPSPGPGDLMILTSGDSLQLVLTEDRPGTPGEEGTPWRGWARMDFRELLWETVSSRWTAALSFEPARREIPGGWDMVSPDSSFLGQLRVRSSHLTAGDGEGPILPVEGVFEVEGSVRIENREFPVHGVVRHSRRTAEM